MLIKTVEPECTSVSNGKEIRGRKQRARVRIKIPPWSERQKETRAVRALGAACRPSSGPGGWQGLRCAEAWSAEPEPGRRRDAHFFYLRWTDHVWWLLERWGAQFLDSPQIQAHLCWPVCVTGTLPAGAAAACPAQR